MKSRTALIVITIVSLCVLGLTPFIGLISPDDSALFNTLFIEVRLPRVLLAFIAGAGLAVCGMVFQAMFHNALATPFTLGVASGASLGAALYVYFGLTLSFFGLHGITLAAFVGALLAITIVFSLSRLKGGLSTETLLLTGVAVNFFFSSMILLIQYLNNVNDSFRVLRWLMGAINTVGYQDIFQLLPFVMISVLVMLGLKRELNLLMSGDDIAASRGVSVHTVRYLLFFVTSLCVGAVVSICGPIGFIGMMVPHMCRLIVGSDHHWLTPATMLVGGSFLVMCDTLARTLIAPSEIPVGVITTLLGGPFFLWLLIRARINNHN
jgi:iron complex transport system permease protein